MFYSPLLHPIQEVITYMVSNYTNELTTSGLLKMIDELSERISKLEVKLAKMRKLIGVLFKLVDERSTK
jgi:hypothetical protein